jgi:hypothetical protein
VGDSEGAVKIDNYALTMFQTCPAKYNLRMNDGWTSDRKSAALAAGTAIHAGLATWYRGEGLEAAFRAIVKDYTIDPGDDYRTVEKVLKVMHEYTRAYPSESFNVIGLPDHPMVEVPFTLDTGMFLSCAECGPLAGAWDKQNALCPNCAQSLEPIEYGGILDTLVEFGANQVYILEHKSTSQLGSYYFNQYKPNNQVAGYIWAARQLTGKRVGGAIINAIGWYKSGTTKFERQISTRSDDEITEWLEQVRMICEAIHQAKQTKHYPMHTAACTLYGLCEFHSVHSRSTQIERERMLEMNYTREKWDYERRE